jgi:hypothetical protein
LNFATVAKVYLIDAEAKRVLVGEHLGGWTPFRCDISKWVADTDLECLTFEVHVDELSGHNTQGFLPIIEPHFGGIWQPVFIVQTPTVYLDDLRLAVQGLWNDGTPKWVIEVPILGDALRLNFAFGDPPRFNGESLRFLNWRDLVNPKSHRR